VAGTLVKLLERATSENTDPQYLEQFVLTSWYFDSPQNILALLAKRLTEVNFR
jgi:hypothetical protein